MGIVFLINNVAAILSFEQGGLLVNPPPLAESFGRPVEGLRVIWVILDEWDYRLSFEERPDDLDLPNFDYMRRQSLFATSAYAPANETFPSIQSMILVPKRSDDPVSNTQPATAISPPDLPIPWNVETWDSLETVFSQSHQRGINTAVLGQEFIPYCRLYATYLTRCWEQGNPWSEESRNAIHHVPAFLGYVALNVPRAKRWLPPERHDYSEAGYHAFFKENQSVASDPEIGFAFMHWMVPHGPFVFDRKLDNYVEVNNEPGRYLDNLALADKMVGEMIAALIKAGLWENTALILSADHPWRKSAGYDGKTDPRVPFLGSVEIWDSQKA